MVEQGLFYRQENFQNGNDSKYVDARVKDIVYDASSNQGICIYEGLLQYHKYFKGYLPETKADKNMWKRALTKNIDVSVMVLVYYTPSNQCLSVIE